jgi:hypothetical protein
VGSNPVLPPFGIVKFLAQTGSTEVDGALTDVEPDATLFHPTHDGLQPVESFELEPDHLADPRARSRFRPSRRRPIC